MARTITHARGRADRGPLVLGALGVALLVGSLAGCSADGDAVQNAVHEARVGNLATALDTQAALGRADGEAHYDSMATVLTDHLAAARQKLAESDGHVLDNGVRDALAGHIAEAEGLLTAGLPKGDCPATAGNVLMEKVHALKASFASVDASAQAKLEAEAARVAAASDQNHATAPSPASAAPKSGSAGKATTPPAAPKSNNPAPAPKIATPSAPSPPAQPQSGHGSTTGPKTSQVPPSAVDPDGWKTG